MIRVVLDANVYVSAFLQPKGPPGRVLARFLHDEAFEVVLSPSLIEEVHRAFTYPRVRKAIRRDVDPAEWFDEVAVLAIVVPDTDRAAGACRDRDDDKLLSAALEGRADVVVSGEEDLLSMSDYEGVALSSPRAFLARLASG